MAITYTIVQSRDSKLSSLVRKELFTEARQETKDEFVATRQEAAAFRQEANERFFRLEARFDAMDARLKHMEEKFEI